MPRLTKDQRVAVRNRIRAIPDIQQFFDDWILTEADNFVDLPTSNTTDLAHQQGYLKCLKRLREEAGKPPIKTASEKLSKN